METYPISTVEKVLKKTGRLTATGKIFSRHWLQECKKMGLIVPTVAGRGRPGDRYDASAITQICLFCDLARMGFRRAEASSFAFNGITQVIIDRTVLIAGAQPDRLPPKLRIRPASVVLVCSQDWKWKAFWAVEENGVRSLLSSETRKPSPPQSKVFRDRSGEEMGDARAKIEIGITRIAVEVVVALAALSE